MQKRIDRSFASTLRLYLDDSLPPPTARQLYEIELENAQHAVDAKCGSGIRVLHLAHNPRVSPVLYVCNAVCLLIKFYLHTRF